MTRCRWTIRRPLSSAIPAPRHAFTDLFALRTEIGASSNYAKLAYVSPSLFGAQLALSFTPSEGKKCCPSCNAGPHVPGRAGRHLGSGAALFRPMSGRSRSPAMPAWRTAAPNTSLPGQEGVSDLGAGPARRLSRQ